MATIRNLPTVPVDGSGMGATGVPGFGGFGAGDMAFSGSSLRDVDPDHTGGSRGGPSSKGKTKEDDEPKTTELERVEVTAKRKEFINPKFYYDTRRVPISSMTKDLIDWLLKNDPDAISDDGMTVRVRTGDKKIVSDYNGSVRAEPPDNLPLPQKQQRLARYEIQRSDFGVDTRIDRGEPLSSYGDVLAAKRIEVQRQQEQQQAQPRTRLEYLQSRWGHMTNAEAKEFIGYDNRAALRFASGAVGDAVALPGSIKDGRYGDAAAETLSVAGGPIIGKAGALASKLGVGKFVGFIPIWFKGTSKVAGEAYEASAGFVLMLSAPVRTKILRMFPGRASGGLNLPEVTGQWLKGTEGQAGAIPGQIAAKLNGRQFSNFNRFREAFWKEVAADPSLTSQFKAADVLLMKRGFAPTALESQQVGKLTKYILHHKDPLGNGSSVYNMNNITIVTPRFHVDVLDRAFHFSNRAKP